MTNPRRSRISSHHHPPTRLLSEGKRSIGFGWEGTSCVVAGKQFSYYIVAKREEKNQRLQLQKKLLLVLTDRQIYTPAKENFNLRYLALSVHVYTGSLCVNKETRLARVPHRCRQYRHGPHRRRGGGEGARTLLCPLYYKKCERPVVRREKEEGCVGMFAVCLSVAIKSSNCASVCPGRLEVGTVLIKLYGPR
ncbi:hypothetical protein J6590_021539 [Homalodisca vitripennis]|nr:hypothetical protein J6590_021539 [Homalodisca vitripennis]